MNIQRGDLWATAVGAQTPAEFLAGCIEAGYQPDDIEGMVRDYVADLPSIFGEPVPKNECDDIAEAMTYILERHIAGEVDG